MTCPLCSTPAAPRFGVREGRGYHRCGVCRLVFMDPAFHPRAGAERARYAEHNNDPDDPRYRAFLRRLAVPLMERLHPGARGLDYGSGPGPTLSLILAGAGFPTVDWDPYFAPDQAVLTGVYDFVTCSETAEHFFRPQEEFRRMDALLAPGGWLGIMTGIFHPDLDFQEWWYVRDPTHVAFYAPETLEWIGARHGWLLEVVGPTVVLFRKEGGEQDPSGAPFRPTLAPAGRGLLAPGP